MQHLQHTPMELCVWWWWGGVLQFSHDNAVANANHADGSQVQFPHPVLSVQQCDDLDSNLPVQEFAWRMLAEVSLEEEAFLKLAPTIFA